MGERLTVEQREELAEHLEQAAKIIRRLLLPPREVGTARRRHFECAWCGDITASDAGGTSHAVTCPTRDAKLWLMEVPRDC